MRDKTQIKRKHTLGKPSIESLSTGEMCLVVPENLLYIKKDFENLLPIGTGGKQCILVSSFGTPRENGIALQAAYNDAKTRTPSASNVINIVATPGTYKFPVAGFIMDTPYINLVSLDGNRSLLFDLELNGVDPYGDPSNQDSTRTPCLSIIANNVFVKGVNASKTYSANYNMYVGLGDYVFPILVDGGSSVIVENCKGGDNSFGSAADQHSFIFSSSEGTFNNCIGGDYSFGSYGGPASGKFNNCIGGYSSFAGNGGEASGTFKDCIGGESSFASNGIASGTFNNCIGGGETFGAGGTASGTFINCKGGWASFGGYANAPGIFNNCIGEHDSFGGYSVASGSFNNCTARERSFGGFGILSGKLFFCKLLTGTFSIVSLGGRTVYCIDGNNNVNNQ